MIFLILLIVLAALVLGIFVHAGFFALLVIAAALVLLTVA